MNRTVRASVSVNLHRISIKNSKIGSVLKRKEKRRDDMPPCPTTISSMEQSFGLWQARFAKRD